ncbi:MAG: sigma-70 family RNA polymerase sigma factor [Bacteroidetes bacterium]|nr:sigma-70 family RNA polymerase sigma factor [Bacteroidota bacterium]
MSRYDDRCLIEGIKNKDKAVLKYIYREYYQSVKHLVSDNSGSEEDARDLFQDVMVIIYQKAARNALSLSCSLKTYLFSISRNLWFQRLEKRKYECHFYNLELVEDEMAVHDCDDTPDDEAMEKSRLFMQHFIGLPADCQQILRLFFRKFTYRDIARILKLSNEKYAKSRKFMCKAMLRRRIMKDPKCKRFY